MRQCLALISAFAAVCVRTEGGEKLTQWVFGEEVGGGEQRWGCRCIRVFMHACECVFLCVCVCV